MCFIEVLEEFEYYVVGGLWWLVGVVLFVGGVYLVGLVL